MKDCDKIYDLLKRSFKDYGDELSLMKEDSNWENNPLSVVMSSFVFKLNPFTVLSLLSTLDIKLNDAFQNAFCAYVKICVIGCDAKLAFIKNKSTSLHHKHLIYKHLSDRLSDNNIYLLNILNQDQELVNYIKVQTL